MNKTIIRFIILISIFKITFFDFKGLSDQTEQLNDFQYLKIYNRMIYYSDFLSNKTKQNLLNINKSICKILLNKGYTGNLTRTCLLYRTIKDPKDDKIPNFIYIHNKTGKYLYLKELTEESYKNLFNNINGQNFVLAKIKFSGSIQTKQVMTDLFCLPNEECKYERQVIRENNKNKLNLGIITGGKMAVYQYKNFFNPLNIVIENNSKLIEIPQENKEYEIIIYKDPRIGPMDNRMYTPVSEIIYNNK